MSDAVSEALIARQPPEAQQIIRALLERDRASQELIQDLRQENRLLRHQLEEAQRRLNLTPANSSRPPSTVHPHARPAPKRPKGKRRQGGQPGHRRHTRPLVPADQCTEVIPRKPAACRRCGEALTGTDPAPLRHQTFELPEIKPIIVEYQLHRLVCPCCQATTCGQLPEGVPTTQAGPRLVAFTALLMGYFRQSKRRAAQFLGTLLNVPASAGWVVKLQGLASDALAGPYEELARALPAEPRLGIDESPTKQGKDKAWLWTFVAATFTVFAYRLSRKALVPLELLGVGYKGVVTCDRARMYWSVGKPQWCWAHLQRDFQALIDHADKAVSRLGHQLMRQARQLFALWGQYKAKEISWKAFQGQMGPVQAEVERLLVDGAFSGKARVRGMCQELYRHRKWLWQFVRKRGVEPTNNASERALRHAVIWRKLSFGTQSGRGSRFVERMLTVVETCRQRKLNTYKYLVDAVEAHFKQAAAPSLLARA